MYIVCSLMHYIILAVVTVGLAYFLYRPSVDSDNMAGDATFSFGEIINKRLFEDDLVELAGRLRDKNKSIYDLDATRADMSPEKDKYVFICIYQMHASIVVVDQELFNTLLFEPVWGQMIDGPKHHLSQSSDVYQRMATSVPLQQYHVCLDERKNYILARNMFYFDWFLKSRSFYVGESAISYLYFQLLSLCVVPQRYRLIDSDCLEFAKSMAKEVAVRENGVRVKEVEALFTALTVSEQYVSASLERSSRNSPESAFSMAASYFVSFQPVRLLIFGAVCVLFGLAILRFLLG
ncbi:uncharacterized protein [Asterias amurensis]|uniref:uncharacterized protein isoform X1 n=1 Tax=Asterias amurensis TaxID=7602 RepID=UPI003AB716FD